MIKRALQSIHKAAFEPLLIEVMSAVALLAYLLAAVFFPHTPAVNSGVTDWDFHMMLVFLTVLVYSLPVLMTDKIRIVRCTLSYLTSMFWVWLGLSSIYACDHLTICNILAMTMGLGNIYAFLIHVYVLKHIRIQSTL